MRVVDKITGEVIDDEEYYIKVSDGTVYAYTYSPVAGHFDNDRLQLHSRKKLMLDQRSLKW